MGKPNVSTLFIITAIIVEEKDVQVIADKTSDIREKYIQTSEIKSRNHFRKIQESFVLKAESKRLLEEAKMMVEREIEKGKYII